MKKTNRAYCILLFFLMSVLSSAVVYGGGSSYSWKPNVGGTFRGKFEYQTDVDNGRFQVRDARVNVKGRPFSLFEYKLEVNLSDKGVIRAHDLFGRFHFCDVASLAAGQFRVPISVDAARAPHVRLFANRSFVGKQIGNVYDVGVKGTYVWAKIGLTAELGVYNGKGSAPSDREWQTKFLYVGHLKYRKSGLTVNLSGLTMKPDVVRMNLYDVCMSYEYQRFFLEGEYLFKHFSAGDIEPVHSCNVTAAYLLPLSSRYVHRLRFLGRFDMMTDNCRGIADEDGRLSIDDTARKRATVGLTFGYDKQIKAELRLNFEKYFYAEGVEIGESDHDKIVAELMLNF